MAPCAYINPLRQLGYEEFALCIFDDSGVEIRRFQKRFQDGVTPDEMANYASEIMTRVEADLLDQQIAPEVMP